jgi:branched-chain amino acid transport system permease protein
MNAALLLTQALNSLALAMNLFVIAAGLTLIFGVLRIVNFAHGAFYMLGAYLLYSVLGRFGDGPFVFWAGVVVAGAVLGAVAWLIERLLLRRLYDRDHLVQLLFTFALVLIIGDLVRIVWGTEQHAVSYPAGLGGAVDLGAIRYPAYLLFLIGVGPLVALALAFVIDHTRWGRIVRAARLDREMLAALGVNVKGVYAAVFAAGAALAGIGGALAAPRMAVQPGMDATIIIECFVIVIVGGLGSLWGSFLGALILGAVTNFGILAVGEWEVVLIYVMMILVLLARPWGLLGRPEQVRH